MGLQKKFRHFSSPVASGTVVSVLFSPLRRTPIAFILVKSSVGGLWQPRKLGQVLFHCCYTWSALVHPVPEDFLLQRGCLDKFDAQPPVKIKKHRFPQGVQTTITVCHTLLRR